jgi:hypothetical protein
MHPSLVVNDVIYRFYFDHQNGHPLFHLILMPSPIGTGFFVAIRSFFGEVWEMGGWAKFFCLFG